MKPKRAKVVGAGRRDICNDELGYLYPLPNIIRLFISGRMSWVRHVARRSEYGFERVTRRKAPHTRPRPR